MARWTGTWLEGPTVSLREMRHPNTWVGQRLGLPKEGSSSVASFSSRIAAFFVDIVASSLVGALIVSGLDHPANIVRQLVPYGVLLAEHVLGVALTGQTLGMRLLSLKVLRLKDVTKPPGFAPALLRSLVLLASIGVAGLVSRDGRGLHDLAAGSIVVRD